MNIQTAYQHLLQSLRASYPPGEASSIARIVFEDAFEIRNVAREDVLDSEQIRHLEEIQQRLLEGEPVQYALGQAQFYGLMLKVGPAVLIPRQETEELVHWILEDHPQRGTLRGLDIGTGSGCIPLALKAQWAAAQWTGVDVSEQALELARENAESLQLEVAFRLMDVLQEESWPELGALDIIVSNPPYIPKSERALMPERVLQYEPSMALFVEDADPLLFYRKIAQLAKLQLTKGGKLYFETNEFNALEVSALLKEQGFHSVELRKDMQGKDRMICAQQ